MENVKDLLREMEHYAEKGHVPIINERGRAVFAEIVKKKQPQKILEIGTAIGYSALLALSLVSAGAEVTTLELSEERIAAARGYIDRSPYKDKITIIPGDAGETLQNLQGKYDLIFIDAAKGQYVDYWHKVQPLLADDGVIIADNVLFRGYVLGDGAVPRRFRTIVKRLRLYIETIKNTAGFRSEIYENGDGLAVSWRER